MEEEETQDFGIGLSLTVVEVAVVVINLHGVCIRHGLLQFKVLHKLHLSKLKMLKMVSSVGPSCDRCTRGLASLAHMFWNCPNIATYWNTVFQTLSKFLKYQLKPEPILPLSGVGSVDVQLSDTQTRMFCFVTLMARRLILLCWKQKTPPSHWTLIKDIMGHLGGNLICIKGKSGHVLPNLTVYYKAFQHKYITN